MKKTLAVMTALLLFLSLAGCGKKPAQPSGVPAGWTVIPASAVKLPDKAAEAFKKVSDGSDVPVALIATQVVAGVNYCFLSEVTDADGQKAYELVYVYADLEGGYSVMHTEPLHPWSRYLGGTAPSAGMAEKGFFMEAPAGAAFSADMAAEEAAALPEENGAYAGGWSLYEGLTSRLKKEHRAVFDKAVSDGTEPLLLLSTEMGDGTNYCFLTRSASGLGYAVVHEDRGVCTLTESGPVELSAAGD